MFLWKFIGLEIISRSFSLLVDPNLNAHTAPQLGIVVVSFACTRNGAVKT